MSRSNPRVLSVLERAGARRGRGQEVDRDSRGRGARHAQAVRHPIGCAIAVFCKRG